MQEFLNTLKGQVNCLNGILLLLIVGVILFRLKKKSALPVLVSAAVIFYIVATDYLPNALSAWLEQKYQPLIDCTSVPFAKTSSVIIHVLGGGFGADAHRAALAQLSLESKGRLTEGIRLFHCFDSATLVFSGNTYNGRMGMAEVYRKAAISLGIDSLKINVLESAATTAEEATHLKEVYPRDRNLILVTSAIHMPRAMHIFKRTGFSPVAAPANFFLHDNSIYHVGFWPSLDNIHKMDALLREALGLLKFEWQKETVSLTSKV